MTIVIKLNMVTMINVTFLASITSMFSNLMQQVAACCSINALVLINKVLYTSPATTWIGYCMLSGESSQYVITNQPPRSTQHFILLG